MAGVERGQDGFVIFFTSGPSPSFQTPQSHPSSLLNINVLQQSSPPILTDRISIISLAHRTISHSNPPAARSIPNLGRVAIRLVALR